ncbi:MAG: serine hydrolase [Defluviitaleaceae bacterium]|nr:serine hydrolase [Defluviitaleaceae bacterium]
MKKFVFAFFAVLIFCVPIYAYESILIPWSFEVYSQPDFRSEAIGSFNAQEISIVEYGHNYWVRIETPAAGWINTRHTPNIFELEEFFAPMGRNISIFYKNLDTKFTYVYNPDRVFFAASLSKSTHALYSFILAERGYLNMYENHIYTPQDEWGGTGVMRFMPFGTQFTTRDLLGLSMRESDNAAFRMLTRITANAELSYREFVEEIGADTRMIRDIISQNTHARDKGLFMYKTFNYIESNSNFGHYLRHDMLNTAQTSHPHFTRWEGSNGWGDNGIGTDVNVSMIKSDYPIARKYGWANNAFHDAGIIYAPSPYILIILSNMERGAHDLFEEISWFIQDFNHRTFVTPHILNAPIQGPQSYGTLPNQLHFTPFIPEPYVQVVFLPMQTGERELPPTKFPNTSRPSRRKDIIKFTH